MSSARSAAANCSADEVETLGIAYHAYPFLDNIHDVLAASDLVVSRGGGTFLAEIAARGVPLIIIPWSGAANNHQARNAQPFAAAGAAVVIPDEQLSPERCSPRCMTSCPIPANAPPWPPPAVRLGHPESAQRLVSFIEELAHQHPGAFLW